MKKLKLYFFVLLVLAGCQNTNSRTGSIAEPLQRDSILYAEGFTIERFEDHIRIDVRNPWDTASTLQTYILVSKNRPLPENLPAGTLVRTPLERVIVYSSVQCGILEALGIREQLVGVCEPQYIDTEFVKEGLANGSIADVGHGSAPDVEKIIECQPDAIIATPLENNSYGRVEKIGVPILECVDYMETSPLARTEWIRFLGLFFEKEQQADSLFRATVDSYEKVRQLAAKVTYKPTVLPEKRYGSVWYIAGGNSYMARLFADAGADYPWKDEPVSGSMPLSFENVLEKAADADIWILKYNRPQNMTYSDLAADFPGYRYFSAYKNKRIFACNTGQVPYYEELPLHPDYVLKDLVWIFHPELLPGYRPRYFSPMPE